MTGKKNLTERAENLFKEKHKRFPSSEADEDALASCVEACRKDETLGLTSGEDETEGAEVAKKKITKITKAEDAEETPKVKSKKEKKEKKVKAKKSEDKPAAETPKKKRGRPPGSKNGTKKEKSAKDEPKKKRGRPPGTKSKVVKAAKSAKADAPKKRGRPPGSKKLPSLKKAIAAKERGEARAAEQKTGKRGRQPKMVPLADLKALQKEVKLAAKAHKKLEKAFAAYRAKTLKATNRLLKFATKLS